MARCSTDFSPQSSTESEVFGFDFQDDLQAGEMPTSVISWTIVVLSGVDTAFLTRLSGIPTIDSQTPTIVRQRVVGLQRGVRYLMKCLVLTNNGNTLELSAVASGAK
jgi:hypothetical protein